jgi:hypothetical protein
VEVSLSQGGQLELPDLQAPATDALEGSCLKGDRRGTATFYKSLVPSMWYGAAHLLDNDPLSITLNDENSNNLPVHRYGLYTTYQHHACQGIDVRR